MFDHDDGIIHDQRHCGGHSAEGHDVEASAHHIQQQHGGGQGGGNRHDRHEGDLQAAQKNEQDQRRQHHADENGIANADGGRRHQPALVIPVGDGHILRQFVVVFGQAGLYIPDDLNGVGIGLLINHDEHGLLSVRRHLQPLGSLGGIDPRDIVEAHQAVLAAAQNRVPDILQTMDAGVRHGKVKLVMILDAAHRLQHVGCTQGSGDIGEGQTERIQFHRVHFDPVFLGFAPHDAHLGNPVDG